MHCRLCRAFAFFNSINFVFSLFASKLSPLFTLFHTSLLHLQLLSYIANLPQVLSLSAMRLEAVGPLPMTLQSLAVIHCQSAHPTRGLGSLTRLHVTNSVPELVQPALLQRLTITHCQALGRRKFAALLSACTNLERLDVTACKAIKVVELASERLRVLVLAETDVIALSLDCPNLKTLDLAQCSVFPGADSDCFGNLRKLFANSASFVSQPWLEFVMDHCPRLALLNVSATAFEWHNRHVLELCTRLFQLRRLYMNHCLVGRDFNDGVHVRRVTLTAKHLQLLL
jgi:hypothetical protein